MPFSPIPLIPGPWRALSPGNASGFALRLARLLAAPRSHDALAPHHPVSALRAMPLRFFPGWALIEGEATVEQGIIGTFDVLYGPGLMWLIDGESRVLSDLTAGRLPADLARYPVADPGEGAGDAGFIASPLADLAEDDRAADFVRFFCACVWGDDGPFMPIESIDSPVLRGVASFDAEWADEIGPVVTRRDGDDFVGECVIAYARSLFRARLRVREGGVIMEDDTPIATDVLPARRNSAPLRDLRARNDR